MRQVREDCASETLFVPVRPRVTWQEGGMGYSWRAASALFLLASVLACSLVSADETVVVVARFDIHDEADPETFPVTEVFAGWFEKAYSAFADITVVTLDRSLPMSGDHSSEIAAFCEDAGGDIIVWGTYELSGMLVSVDLRSQMMAVRADTSMGLDYFLSGEQRFRPSELLRGSDPPDKFLFAAYLLIGDLFSVQQKYFASVTLCQKALEHGDNVRPEFLAVAYRVMGDQYLYMEQYSSAVESYSKSLELDAEPDEQIAHVLRGRGSAFVLRGEPELGLADHLLAVELDPDNAWGQAKLGATLYGLGLSEEALPHMSRAIELVPDFALYYRDRSRAYFQLQEWELALQDINYAIELNPSYPEGYSMKAVILVGMGLEEESLPYYETALSLETRIPQTCWLLVDRSIRYFNMEEYGLAIDDLSATLELDPECWEAYFRRGICLAFQGPENLDAAEADLEVFLENVEDRDLYAPEIEITMELLADIEIIRDENP